VLNSAVRRDIYLYEKAWRGKRPVAKGKNTAGRTWAVRAAAVLLVFLVLQSIVTGCSGRKDTPEAEGGENSIKAGILLETAGVLEKNLYTMFMPGILFESNGRYETFWLLQEQIDSLFPLYGYAIRNMEEEEGDDEALREILLAEAGEQVHAGELAEDICDPRQVEEAAQEAAGEPDRSLEELLREENEAAIKAEQSGSLFEPHIQQTQVDAAVLQDFETLLKQFYIVDSNTMAGSDQLDVDKLLAVDMTVSKEDPGPQILIYHTHSREAFADSVQGDVSTTIVGVGERLAQVLETYGYSVLHHTVEYDTDRNQAYSKALPGIEQILQDNPSIQVVIDLHRDEMPEETRLVMDLDGRPTARFMFFNGLSRTKKTGNIAYLYNENLESNLAFSFQMQKKAVEYYPGLTRKIYLKGYRYNMHLKDKYLLIELGAQNNTVEEAMNACDPLAHILDMVLSGE